MIKEKENINYYSFQFVTKLLIKTNLLQYETTESSKRCSFLKSFPEGGEKMHSLMNPQLSLFSWENEAWSVKEVQLTQLEACPTKYSSAFDHN